MPIVEFDKDMVAKIAEDDRVLAKQVQIIEGYIVINVDYEYNIPLDSCRTADAVLEMVSHLTEKTWMTNDVLRRFIFMARGAIDGKI